MELVSSALDCVHETVKDNPEVDDSKMPPATEPDLGRLESVLDVLAGELGGLTMKIAALQGLPHKAAEILDAALKTDDHCRTALHKLDALAQGFDRLREQNTALLRRLNYATAILEQMLPLMLKASSVADYVEELGLEELAAAEFRVKLNAFRDGQRALAQGRIREANARLLEVARSRPRSAAAAVAVAAAQTAGQEMYGAQKTMLRAVRLRPTTPSWPSCNGASHR